MARRRRFSSNTIRSVGALLPYDVLAKAMEGEGLEGLASEDFGLEAGMRFRDAVNDAWNEAKADWWRFQSDLQKLPTGDATATALTRERWLLPLLRLLGFDAIEVVSGSLQVGGTGYPISHMNGATPLHLMGARVELDGRVTGVRGAARLSPHSLLQQFLNRSDDHLWGVVANGERLRILRDSVSLTRPAYVEFDLEAMFNGDVFPDFTLLYKVAHATRFVGERPTDCLLERWIAAARDEGIRALDQLRDGVESALVVLGSGFLSQRDNHELRALIVTEELDSRDLYRYLLRLIYRLLFLFVAEDRDLLHLRGTGLEERERYDRYYSTGRLRDLASRPAGSGHVDLWEGLGALMNVLGRDEGEPRLGLPGLGSFLWAGDSIGPLVRARIANEDLLAALRGLAYVEDDGNLRRIDFAGLGAEELGSVYESLLELHPRIDTEERRFLLEGGAGSERKTTGSYYTPTSLITELLNSALDPVLEKAARGPDPEKAILALKVVDPAVGSGHFLVAAAHRIAKRLAEVRTGEPEPPEEAYRTALRDVVSHCLFAVDINDLAVELCKVSLWLEALEPGRPLSFLDHRILCGNSLLGATPALLAAGVPDAAFKPLEGDDKKVVSELRKRNKRERAGQGTFSAVTRALDTTDLSETLADIDALTDDSTEAVHVKEQRYQKLAASPEFRRAKLAADAWCAAFVCRKNPGVPAVTHDIFLRLANDPGSVPAVVGDAIERLADEYGFFHWHLAFPDVFRTAARKVRAENEVAGWSGGFDVVLGNPPWEHTELKEKEFFAVRRPDIAEAQTGAARKRMIDRLAEEDPPLHAAFLAARRQHDGVGHLISASGRYPLCGRGRINTYAIFAETNRSLVGRSGRAGFIVESGIATSDTYKDFIATLMDEKELVSFYDFVNTEGLFPAVHRTHPHFCLMTLAGTPMAAAVDFAFWNANVDDLRDAERHFTLSAADVRLLSPNTRTCPVFRTRRDAEITKGIYRRVPVLLREAPPEENPWGVSFRQGLFNMTSDSHLFRTRVELEAEGWRLEGNVFVGAVGASGDGDTARAAPRYLPLYEAKMIHHFDHRWATYDGLETRDLTPAEKRDLGAVSLPRYWVAKLEVDERLRGRWDREWLLGWRDITNTTNERTVIASMVPRAGVGNNLPLMMLTDSDAVGAGCLAANLTSVACDYVARLKVGGTHLNFFIYEQLPVFPPSWYQESPPWSPDETLAEWLMPRVLELIPNPPVPLRKPRPTSPERHHWSSW
ncbi:MAG: Eco57I restriction-modification methylase domain-containing protein [Thermoleophilia bacterium]